MSNSSIRFVGCLLGFLCLLGCPPRTEQSQQSQTENKDPPKPVGPAPTVAVDNANHDFGVMEAGEEKQHEFKIRNTGEGVLTLVQGKASCKCTSFTLDKTELKKDEVATAVVKWKPVEVQEKFRQTASITTNDPNMPEIQLNILGAVKSIFTVKPGLFWQLGEYHEGEERVFPGYVFCNVDEKFVIEDLKTSSPALVASIEPATDIELQKESAKAGYKINLTAGKALPVGQFIESMTFKCKAGREAEMRVELKGFRSGPLTIIGKGFFSKTMLWEIGTFNAREGFKQNLSLFYNSAQGDELKLEGVESTPPGITVNLKKDDNFKGNGTRQRYIAEIEIPPGDKAQIFNEGKAAAVTLKTNSPEIGSIVLRLKYNALLN